MYAGSLIRRHGSTPGSDSGCALATRFASCCWFWFVRLHYASRLGAIQYYLFPRVLFQAQSCCSNIHTCLFATYRNGRPRKSSCGVGGESDGDWVWVWARFRDRSLTPSMRAASNHSLGRQGCLRTNSGGSDPAPWTTSSLGVGWFSSIYCALMLLICRIEILNANSPSVDLTSSPRLPNHTAHDARVLDACNGAHFEAVSPFCFPSSVPALTSHEASLSPTHRCLTPQRLHVQKENTPLHVPPALPRPRPPSQGQKSRAKLGRPQPAAAKRDPLRDPALPDAPQ